MKFQHKIAIALALIAGACLPAHSKTDMLGDWHGVLKTSVGDLTLIVTVLENESGGLSAELESPDQAPGTKIPISSFKLANGHLRFEIQRIGASYQGDWVDAEGQWSGEWLQGGGELPLTFKRDPAPGRAVVEGLDGTWEGAVTRNGVDLRLILRVKTGEYGTAVTLDSPDLGAFGMAVSELTRESGTVSFTVPVPGVHFDGTLIDDDSIITGLWTFPGRPDAQVTFVRTSTNAARRERLRPQTPQEPLDYNVEDAVFENPLAHDVTLAGTLTLPHGPGPFPAAILISGSGPQDRDETIYSHKPFAVLADHLTRNGIAVLRYDDRGTRESTGNHGEATSADFATDANAAARYLLTRSEIDPEAIGFIGHSEGGMIGPIAAADNDRIEFLVLLAGPGTSTVQLIRSQSRLMGMSQGRSEEELDRAAPIVERIFSEVALSSGSEDARRRVADLLTPDAIELVAFKTASKDMLVELYARNWFRYFLQYEPQDFLARLEVPVLALNGSLDQQVPAKENLTAIRTALADNPDVTIHELDGLNHMFQTAATGSFGEYADIEETMSPVVLGLVANWINARFAADANRHAAAR